MSASKQAGKQASEQKGSDLATMCYPVLGSIESRLVRTKRERHLPMQHTVSRHSMAVVSRHG
jgi:hypothetical protein